jgi:hypothetical protein
MIARVDGDIKKAQLMLVTLLDSTLLSKFTVVSSTYLQTAPSSTLDVDDFEC